MVVWDHQQEKREAEDDAYRSITPRGVFSLVVWPGASLESSISFMSLGLKLIGVRGTLLIAPLPMKPRATAVPNLEQDSMHL